MSKKTLTELEDRSGEKFKAHIVGDRTYPDHQKWHDGDYSVFVDAFKNLEMRPGDVFVCGYPKSGNHWFYEVINMILQQTSDYIPKKFSEVFNDSFTLEELQSLMESPKPVRVYSHFNPDSIPDSIPKRGVKVIYIVRNFKDMTVSAFHFCKALTVNFPYRGTWEDFLELSLTPPGVAYGLWFEHIQQADLYRKRYPHVPFYVLCYEHVKTNPVEEIRKLCKFLEVPDTLAEEIADKVHFRKMRPALMEGKMSSSTKAFKPGSSGVFRKGVVGDWKNMFTVSQSERVDKMFLEQLSDSPIGQMVKPYMY